VSFLSVESTTTNATTAKATARTNAATACETLSQYYGWDRRKHQEEEVTIVEPPPIHRSSSSCHRRVLVFVRSCSAFAVAAIPGSASTLPPSTAAATAPEEQPHYPPSSTSSSLLLRRCDTTDKHNHRSRHSQPATTAFLDHGSFVFAVVFLVTATAESSQSPAQGSTPTAAQEVRRHRRRCHNNKLPEYLAAPSSESELPWESDRSSLGRSGLQYAFGGI